MVRASMGGIFNINIQLFDSFETYHKQYSNNSLYPFLIKGNRVLQSLKRADIKTPFSLIFGNEARGLDDEFLSVGHAIFINQSKNLDSLNIQTAVSVALYEFTRGEFEKLEN